MFGVSLLVILGAVAVYTVFLGAPGSPGLSLGGQGTVKKLAPIESAELKVSESQPPGYSVEIDYALRNGCVEPAGHEARRFNRAIQIKVQVKEPADPNTPCTMIYRVEKIVVDLGSDFTPGENYRLEVNDKVINFTR